MPIPEGITADKIPLENLYGTGVVLDFRNKKKWDTISAAELEKATPKIEKGDFVVINTGWHTWLNWLKPNKAYEYYNCYPGFVTRCGGLADQEGCESDSGDMACL